MNSSRVVLILGAVLLPLGGLEARLVHLQILTTTETTYDLASKRQSIEIVRPRRGDILDSKNRALAKDEPCFDCYLVLEDVTDSHRIALEWHLPPTERQCRNCWRAGALGPDAASRVTL